MKRHKESPKKRDPMDSGDSFSLPLLIVSGGPRPSAFVLVVVRPGPHSSRPIRLPPSVRQERPRTEPAPAGLTIYSGAGSTGPAPLGGECLQRARRVINARPRRLGDFCSRLLGAARQAAGVERTSPAPESIQWTPPGHIVDQPINVFANGRIPFQVAPSLGRPRRRMRAVFVGPTRTTDLAVRKIVT